MPITYPVTRLRKKLTWDRRSRCSESQVSRRGRSRPGAAGLIAALALVSPAAAPAQTAADSLAHRTLATRAELDSLARVLASAGSSAQRQTLELVRARLGAGDFQAGDRILLQIPALQSAVQPAGEPATLAVAGQPARADTFTVGREQELTLPVGGTIPLDRKSTRLNSSHVSISYAVFCLKKKNN